MITGKNYIGNQLSSEGDITFKTFNPELNVSIQNNFTQATEEEL